MKKVIDEEKSFKNAGFFKRFLAFMIDLFIISIIVSIVTHGLNTTKIEKYSKKLNDLQKEFMSQKVSMEDYVDQATYYTYELERASVLPNSIQLLLFIGYFIVFQFLNKGQTLGKKIFKIKVIENGKDPSLISIIVRALLVNLIFINFISIMFVLVLSSEQYISIYGIFNFIYYIFMIICVFMMLFRDDKVSLHDMITHTNVVEV